MCEYFSFNYEPKTKRVYALLGEDREEARRKSLNPDSHSVIAKWFGIDEDETAKFEIPMKNSEAVKEIIKTVKEKGFKSILRFLKYDGGIPEESLKQSDYDAILNYLKDLRIFRDLIVPDQPSPLRKEIRVNKIVSKIRKILETSRRVAFIVENRFVRDIVLSLFPEFNYDFEIGTRYNKKADDSHLLTVMDFRNPDKELPSDSPVVVAVTKRRIIREEGGDEREYIRYRIVTSPVIDMRGVKDEN